MSLRKHPKLLFDSFAPCNEYEKEDQELQQRYQKCQRLCRILSQSRRQLHSCLQKWHRGLQPHEQTVLWLRPNCLLVMHRNMNILLKIKLANETTQTEWELMRKKTHGCSNLSMHQHVQKFASFWLENIRWMNRTCLMMKHRHHNMGLDQYKRDGMRKMRKMPTTGSNSKIDREM